MDQSWVDAIAKILGAPTALIGVAVIVWWAKDKIALKSDVSAERKRTDKVQEIINSTLEGNHALVMREIRDLRTDTKEEIRLFRLVAEQNKDAVHSNTMAVAVLKEQVNGMPAAVTGMITEKIYHINAAKLSPLAEIETT